MGREGTQKTLVLSTHLHLTWSKHLIFLCAPWMWKTVFPLYFSNIYDMSDKPSSTKAKVFI